MPSLDDYVDRMQKPQGWDEDKSNEYRRKFYRGIPFLKRDANNNVTEDDDLKLFPFVDGTGSPDVQRIQAGKILRVLGIAKMYPDTRKGSLSSSPTTVISRRVFVPVLNPLLTLDFSHETFQTNKYVVDDYWKEPEAKAADNELKTNYLDYNQQPFEVHQKIYEALKAFLEDLKKRAGAHEKLMVDRINFELQSYLKGEKVPSQYVHGIHTFNSLSSGVQKDVIDGTPITLDDFNTAFKLRVLSVAYREWKVFAGDTYRGYKRYLSKLMKKSGNTQAPPAPAAQAAQAPQLVPPPAAQPQAQAQPIDRSDEIENDDNGVFLYKKAVLIANAAGTSTSMVASSLKKYLNAKRITPEQGTNSTGKNRTKLKNYLINNFPDDADVAAAFATDIAAQAAQPSALQSDRATFLEFSDVEMDDLEFEYEGVSDQELDDILKEAEQITYDSESEASVTSETSETSETSDMNMAYDSDSLAAKSYDSSSDSSAQAKSYDSSSDSSAQAKSYDSSSDSSQTAMSYDSSSDMEI